MALQAAAIWGFLTVVFTAALPEGLVAEARTPPAVTAGHPFPLTLTVRNTGREAFTVTHVAARAATLDRISLARPDPAPLAPPGALMGSIVWPYRKAVGPGEVFRVRFVAEAAEPGPVRGSLEIQVGILPRKVPFSLEVRPRPKAPAPAGAGRRPAR